MGNRRCFTSSGLSKPIIIASANANESANSNQHSNIVNGHIIKPIKIDTLIEKIGKWLNIEWLHEPTHKPQTQAANKSRIHTTGLSIDTTKQLIELAEIGHLTELKKAVQKLENQGGITQELATEFKTWLQQVRFDKILSTLRNNDNV